MAKSSGKKTTGDTLQRIGATSLAVTMALATVGGNAIIATAAPAKTAEKNSVKQSQSNTVYSALIGDQTVDLTQAEDGTYTGTVDEYTGRPSQTIAIVSNADGLKVDTVTGHDKPNPDDLTTVGVVNQTGVMTYTGKFATSSEPDAPTADVNITVNYTNTLGKEVTVVDGQNDGQFKDGKATASDVTLDDDDQPTIDEITLSDGTKLPITWDQNVSTRFVDDHTETFKNGVATGIVPAPDGYQGDGWNVTVNIQAVRSDTWTTVIGGKTFDLTAHEDGSQTLDVTDKLAEYPTKQLEVSGSNGKMIVLDLQTKPTASVTDTIGQIHVTGTATYHADATVDNPSITVTVPYEYTYGDKLTLGGNLSGELTETNSFWTATIPSQTIANDGTISLTNIEFSNGEKLPVTWGKPSLGFENNAINITATGSASGPVTVTDPASDQQVSYMVRLPNITATRTDTWKATVNGTDYDLETDKTDGSQSLTLVKPLGQYPDAQASYTSSNGVKGKIDLTVTKPDTSLTDKLGVINVTGVGAYTQDANGDLINGGTPKFDIQAPFAYATGSEITLKSTGGKNIAFTRDKNGTFTATASNLKLDTKNTPSANTLELSDGSKAAITWDKTPTVVDMPTENGTVKYVRLHGTASGKITVTDPTSKAQQDATYTISVDADRAQDASFSKLVVEQTNAKGEKTTIDVPNFTPNTHEYTITLPNTAVGDAYALATTTGVDATVSKQKLTLGDGSTRIMKISVNGVEYTVNVKFVASDLKPDSPAKLTGIYVNMSGEHKKGQLIANWDPNRLDYVITLPDTTTSPYILPEAADGVTIKAGNVIQSAQSSKQEWTVTDTATGVSRVYSVTVTRPVKTAVTEFTPKEPVKQKQTAQPDNDKDTALDSHGYVDQTGKYIPVEKNEYQIPEGGTFSYEAKAGQSATVNISNVGMTYTYTVNVLAPDGQTFSQHVYKVTYITTATHKAELSGIAVDGKLINGFKPEQHEYTVSVNDPNQWTIVAQYDKTTGMSVMTEKNGANATITVTSGDNLTTTTYKVHVTQKILSGDGTVGVGGLAETGANVTFMAIGVLVLAVLAGIAYAVQRLLRHGKNLPESAEPTQESDTTSEDTQSNEAQ